MKVKLPLQSVLPWDIRSKYQRFTYSTISCFGRRQNATPALSAELCASSDVSALPVPMAESVRRRRRDRRSRGRSCAMRLTGHFCDKIPHSLQRRLPALLGPRSCH
jgi:hypothetical protein